MADLPQTPSPVYSLPGPSAYVLATDEGVFEPFHANGAIVRAGQPARRIHFLADPSPDFSNYEVHRGRESAKHCCVATG